MDPVIDRAVLVKMQIIHFLVYSNAIVFDSLFALTEYYFSLTQGEEFFCIRLFVILVYVNAIFRNA